MYGVMLIGQTSDTSNPLIPFVYVEPTDAYPTGFISDIESLSYSVVTPAGLNHIPTTVVDISDAHAGSRIRRGTYVPPISFGGADPIGVYTVTWVATRVVGETAPITWTTKIQVLAAGTPMPDRYVTLAEMRDQGVPALFSDAQIVESINLASGIVDKVTHRFFEPRWMEVSTDGRGRGVHAQYDHPIIGVESLDIKVSSSIPHVSYYAEETALDPEYMVVYNRHARPYPLVRPDDRNNPRVESTFSGGHHSRMGVFSDHPQNLATKGWFGYTDPNGTLFGETPALIKRAVIMLAMHEIRPLWETFGGGPGTLTSGPIRRQKTREQEIEYAGSTSAGALQAGGLTGIAAVDVILASFMGPVYIRAV